MIGERIEYTDHGSGNNKIKKKDFYYKVQQEYPDFTLQIAMDPDFSEETVSV